MEICPSCHEPIAAGALSCRHCGAPRPAADPAKAPNPDLELVSVFATPDQGRIVLAKSLLESEQIDYMVRGEGVQDLFAWGRALTGFNPVVGSVEFIVRAEDAGRARDLLRSLDEYTKPL
ncbi:MAG TPA: DUF2007 domain-containing protein [Vicinamibacterales bacterium]|nr:DUF2007 domain-containing protein [Vicinamibacterales bacterium]